MPLEDWRIRKLEATITHQRQVIRQQEQRIRAQNQEARRLQQEMRRVEQDARDRRARPASGGPPG